MAQMLPTKRYQELQLLRQAAEAVSVGVVEAAGTHVVDLVRDDVKDGCDDAIAEEPAVSKGNQVAQQLEVLLWHVCLDQSVHNGRDATAVLGAHALREDLELHLRFAWMTRPIR
jgi:hypothetical protein